jgi:hypothetical protein
MDILHAIGTTSIVRLRKTIPPHCAEIFVKLEWENPTGSVKERVANAVISRAEPDDRLKPGHTVVEYTGGSTGTSLAFVCAAKGYRPQIVSSDAFSREKPDHVAALEWGSQRPRPWWRPWTRSSGSRAPRSWRPTRGWPRASGPVGSGSNMGGSRSRDGARSGRCGCKPRMPRWPSRGRRPPRCNGGGDGSRGGAGRRRPLWPWPASS